MFAHQWFHLKNLANQMVPMHLYWTNRVRRRLMFAMGCLVNVWMYCMCCLNSVHWPIPKIRKMLPRLPMKMPIHLGLVLMGHYAQTYDIGMVMVKSNLYLIAEIAVNSIALNIAEKPSNYRDRNKKKIFFIEFTEFSWKIDFKLWTQLFISRKINKKGKKRNTHGPWLGPVCVGETDNGPIDDGGVWWWCENEDIADIELQL